MVAARRRYVQSLNWKMAAMYKPAVPSTLAAEKSVLSKPDNMDNSRQIARSSTKQEYQLQPE
jgi:hypothetical protein